jgi:hypothetical protein
MNTLAIKRFLRVVPSINFTTMKTRFIYPVFVIILMTLTYCKKEFPKDPLAMSDLSVTGCKTKGDNAKTVDPEYITIKTVDNYYLRFSHINSFFNCEPGEITISTGISADRITINEDETTSSANCICPYDVVFKLGPLEYGTYTIIFQKGGLTFKEYSLIYKKSTDVRIDI